ncbi:MAG: nucleotidyltransferase family protein [Janthinobacterium lividum]
MTVDVVVLAGGKNSPAMAAASGVENRAMTPIGTRTMLDYVTSALAETPSIGRIYVVGDVPGSTGYTQVTGGETLLDNLLAGLKAAGDQERVLISTSDIPFVTPASLEDFVEKAAASGADLCCSYVPVAACTQKYPEMKRTAVKVAEGQFTLGNVMLVNPRFMIAHQATISQAYAARKSPVKVAKMLGMGLLARLIGAQLVSSKMLTIAALEQAVSRLLGSGGRAVGICSAHPEIGTDVDNPEDVAIARRILAGS